MTPTSTARTASLPPIDTTVPAETERATFALGCFWSPDAQFGCAPGVIRTHSGYAGGTTKNPTYRDLGDHTETVEVEYDPAETSYEDLLTLFWDSHDPTRRGSNRQYMSAIFTRNDAQQRLAEETSTEQTRTYDRAVQTEIKPLATFYPAEDYHQNYKLRSVDPLIDEFEQIYPEPEDFIASAAASRVNGYVGGYGTAERLAEEISGFGLSAEGEERLRALVRS